MDGGDVTSDQIIAELVDMGFDLSDVTEAIEIVGPSLNNVIDFILNDSHRNNKGASTSSSCLMNNKVLGKRERTTTTSLQSSSKLRQQNITEHLKLTPGLKRRKTRGFSNVSVSTSSFLNGHVEEPEACSTTKHGSNPCPETSMVPSYSKNKDIIGFDWENKVNNLLLRHFGYSSLKGFQKEALAAWLAHEDCLVLAATGSGISLLHPLCSCLLVLNRDIST